MAQQPSPPPPGSYPPPAAPQQNGVAIGGMVTGIVSVVFFWLFFIGIPAGIVGVVLGFVGLNKSKQMNGMGRGMAITGIVTGAVGTVAAVVIIIVAAMAANETQRQFEEFEDLFGAAMVLPVLLPKLRRRS